MQTMALRRQSQRDFSDIEDSDLESPDWSHLLQTQAATEDQVQMQLETQVYHADQMWGSSEDLLDTQVYHADQMWGSSEDLLATHGRRVKKKAKPMAKSAPRAVKKKRARAVKKRLQLPSKHNAE